MDRINAALETDDPAWGFYRMMTQHDRDEMDRRLIAAQHPLAYQAGTQWSRFQQLHREQWRVTE